MVDRPMFRVGDIVKCEYAHNGMVRGAKYEIVGDSGGAFIRVKGVDGYHPADCVKLHKKCMDAIVITTDCDNTTARLMRGKETLREVKLTRSKEDRHNLKTLAAYAVQKLLPPDGNMLINVKAGYTGAVAVVNSKNPNITDGRIIEFTGGRCTNLGKFVGYDFADLNAVKKHCKTRHINFDVVELHRN